MQQTKLLYWDDIKISLPKNSVLLNMAFSFPAPHWAANTNIYEVNVRQYTPEGTFNAFADHLPRLKDMGVKTLWFMPITPIAEKNRKGTLGSYYACSDYTAINPEFGRITDFRNLVRKAHEMGFRVIIDWVANHTGWDHVWTKEHPGWYKREPDGEFKRASGMDDIIELDYENPHLRSAIIEAMKFWIEDCDVDGFRCDLAFWVELNFWKEARMELEKIKSLFWLGEFDPLDSPDYLQVFDAVYTWTWMHKTEEFYKKQISFDDLLNILHRYDKIVLPGAMSSWFTTNHDENSWNGTEYEKYGEMAKALAVFSCIWNGIPLIYSGQELPNKKRLKFFDKDQIEWKERDELHDFYKTLLHLHSSHPALKAGDKNVSTHLIKTKDKQEVLFFLRKKDINEVMVIINFSGNEQEIMIEDALVAGKFRNIFTNEVISVSQSAKFTIQPWGFSVFVK